MNDEVLTPISQAMKEGVITRAELRQLMRRSNFAGFLHLLKFIVVLAITGTLVIVSFDTLWLIPAMFAHGIIVVHHFSLQHECCHYTPFRSRWLNEVVGNYCGFLLVIPNKYFRYEHCNHHTFTQQKGYDPELIELPISLSRYLWYLSSIPYWYAQFEALIRHVFGRISKSEEEFIPVEERRAVIVEARTYFALYLLIIAGSVALDWWGALWLWWIPMFLGEPVMRAIRMTEHVGRPNVTDMKENTRTNLVTRPMRLLCWNMNYHAEHHYASSVPFHALPDLHRRLTGFVHVEKRGYLGAHIDIISQIVGRTPRADATGSEA